MRRQEQGFTIPIVMGIGMVMVLIAAALISKVQNDQAIARLQVRSEGALNAAEIGVTRLQSFLTDQRRFAAQNSSQWSDLVANLNSEIGACPSQPSLLAESVGQSYAQGQWFNAGQPQHQYRLLSYEYRSQPGNNGQVGIGTLTVEGQVTSGLRPAVSQLAVEIPIAIASNPPAPPALSAKSFKISNAAQITGDVYAHRCPDRTDPDLVPGISNSNLVMNDHQPTGAISADLKTGWPAPQIAPHRAISLPVITDNLTLPRPTDVADAQGNFDYVVESDAMNNSIQLADGQKITVQVSANQAVNLYTRGNIDLGGGQVTVQVADQPHPEKLRIYGSDRTVQFSIKDSASVMALIHAPLAIGRAVPAPTTGTGITGSLLLQQWDTATSQSKLPIKQLSNGSALTQLPPTQLGLQLQPISSWQRPGQ